MRFLTTVVVWAGITCFFMYLESGSCQKEEKSCKMIMSDMTKRQLNQIVNCTKALHYRGKDKTAKATCVLKCVMINEHILSSEGTTSKEVIEKFISNEFPKAIGDKCRPPMMECAEKLGKALDPKDEFCKSYDPYLKCVSAAISNVCS